MRDCGKCTLCCKLLETHDIPSNIEEYCAYCLPGDGCSIHINRPEECRIYQCMWSQMNNVGEELRPDRCGVIFDKIAEDIICARLQKRHKLNDFTFGQVNAFLKEGYSVMLFRDKEKKFFLSDKHTKTYVLEKVNDRSLIH